METFSRRIHRQTHFVQTELDGLEVIYDSNLVPNAQPTWFFQQLRSELTPVSKGGRNSAWYVRVNDVDAVLKFYRRGGWIARILRQSYFWMGFRLTRSVKELTLLQDLCAKGLNVARPLAAAVWREGIFYKAALLTEQIPSARPLIDFDSVEPWYRAGQLIAQMHGFGVYHADLNVFNLLIDDGKDPWLIDFDKSWSGKLTDSQRQANLARLKRSVAKVSPTRLEGCFSELLLGYHQSFKKGVE